MDHEATPRPWKWQWTDVNQITIFHNAEGAAELLVRAVNAL